MGALAKLFIKLLKPLARYLVVGVVLGALVFFAYAGAVFLIALVAGFIGFACVKAEHPLVNLNGPVLVALVLAVLWAGATTVALFLDSISVNRLMVQPTDNAVVWLRRDASWFFFEATTIFCLAIVRRWTKSRFAGSALLLAAALAFGLPALAQSELPRPSEVPEILANLQAWVEASDGNLFKISKVLPWIFAGLAGLLFVWHLAFGTDEEEFRSALSSEEWKSFGWATASGLAMLGALVYFGEARFSMLSMEWLVVGGLLVLLVYWLTRSWLRAERPEKASSQLNPAQS